MYLMIDHYDSFVYNLSAYLEEAGQDVLVRREYEITLSEIEGLWPEGILLSPGPKTPREAIFSQKVIEQFQNRIPILGVCLGHQTIAHSFGAKVCKGDRPVHGKVTKLWHSRKGLFAGLPQGFGVTRYHSLAVSERSLPACLRVDARSEDGAVMGISHRSIPVYGVQFHPEAVLTEYGHELLENFFEICREWREGDALTQRA